MEHFVGTGSGQLAIRSQIQLVVLEVGGFHAAPIRPPRPYGSGMAAARTANVSHLGHLKELLLELWLS